jgi:Fic family protein
MAHRTRTGTYQTIAVGDTRVRAFIPHPLPPHPTLRIKARQQRLLEKAHLALGRLDGVRTLLPGTAFFLYTYVRKEAVVSSQIEGTQSSLSDLLLFELDELPGVPLADVEEVSLYVAAMNQGLRRLEEGMPMCGRLIREVHEVLLSRGRGSSKEPGRFRRTQNWIGGSRPNRARFVPPPPGKVADCMARLEKFINDDESNMPVLVKTALAHAQFETIHPFLDGNGRVGRLLITLMLCASGVLKEPLLYLSLYFKENRMTYYDLLDRIRTNGDWESWIDFFVEGVGVTADSAVQTAQRLVKLFEADRIRIGGLGRGAGSALRIHEALKQRPVASMGSLVEATGLSAPTVSASLATLEKLGVLRELTGRRRSRLFGYVGYIRIMNEGTERA